MNEYKLKFTNGDIFEGNIIPETNKAFGTIKYSNGDIYKGSVINNIERYGEGSIYYKNLNKVYANKWINDKPVKTDELVKSATIKNQGKYPNCWAHAISRNFLRLFQITQVITHKYVEQFYKLFYTILTNNFALSSGSNFSKMDYLLNYLKDNYSNQIFNIANKDIIQTHSRDKNPDEFILRMEQDDKEKFISDLKYLFDNNLLFIFNNYYKVTNDKVNNPTKYIKLLLDFKMQPTVGIYVSNYLKNKISSKTKIILDNSEKIDTKCSSSTGTGHMVNLRRWTANGIEFKNSWGLSSGEQGNFTVPDLKYVICEKNDSIAISSLMFDYDNLSNEFKKRIAGSLCMYHDVIDKTLNLDEDFAHVDEPHDIVLYNENGNFFCGKRMYEYVYTEFDENGNKKECTDIYDGNWNGKPNGLGKFKYSSDSAYLKEYCGNFLSGIRFGKGIGIDTDGNIIDCEWDMGLPYGIGKIYYANQKDVDTIGDDNNEHKANMYMGNIKKGEPNGIGVMNYISGDIYKKYDGEFVKGKKEGRGEMIYSNGDIYKGKWENDMANGEGEMIYMSGDIYEGNWVNGVRDGKGKMIYISGDVYEGNWANDVRDGDGEIRYSNGNIFSGNFISDKPFGIGIIIDSARNKIIGEISDDGIIKNTDRDKDGIINYSNGDKYTGNIIDGMANGKGYIIYSNGGKYLGNFIQGKKNGNGTYYLNSGNIYSGNFISDKPNGTGLMTWENGTTYYGEWKNGKMNGEGIYTDLNGVKNYGIWEGGKLINNFVLNKELFNSKTDFKSNDNSTIKNKYLKYKSKYLKLKNLSKTDF
mgnify:CR=1 FL=1